jgi:UDP-N-acetylglucosamine 3-dehydrogenase
MRMKRLNCAVIGVGNIGKHHVRNYSKIKGARLVAVSDVNSEAGRKVAKTYKCNFYGDYKEMLETKAVDIVSIATPAGSHCRIALDCLAAGKNILIEKPVTLTVGEAEKLLKESKKSRVKVMVGHLERFNPAVKKLKAMIVKGDLGEIKSLNFERVGPLPSRDKNVNVVVDMGIHDLDLANFILNAVPQKITAFGGMAKRKNQEDFADILLNYGKTNVHLQTNWITPLKIRRLAVIGTEGYLELDFIKQSLVLYKEKTGKRPIPIVKKEPLREELESFLKDVKLGRTPLVTLEEALVALKTAVKINAQIKSQNSSHR